MNSSLALEILEESRPLSEEKAALQIAKQLFDAVSAQSNRIDGFEKRIDRMELTLETEVKINSREATMVNIMVKNRVRELLPDPIDYTTKSRKYFQSLWHEIHIRFAVPNYREIPKKEYKAVLELIRTWEPMFFAKVIERRSDHA